MPFDLLRRSESGRRGMHKTTTRETEGIAPGPLGGRGGEQTTEKTVYRPVDYRRGDDGIAPATDTGVDASDDEGDGRVAWIETIQKASDAELVRAIRAGARNQRSVSGEGSRTGRRGVLSGGVSGTYEGALRGEATGGASVSARLGPLGPALEAAAEASATLGASFDAEAEAIARLWQLEFVATGKVELFAGFTASAAATAFFNAKDGLGVSGKAEAFAGVKGAASGAVAIRLGPAELRAMAEVAGEAGAGASAEGSFSISFTGIEASGAVEAFAGVKGSISGTTQASLRGKTIVSATGKISVSAGAGASAKGEFSVKGGKLKIKLGGDVTVGAGLGAEVGAEIDFYALAEAIGEIVWENYVKYTRTMDEKALAEIGREPMADAALGKQYRDHGYATYIGDFRAYAAKKLGQGSNGIKRDRVQEMLDARRGQLGMSLTHTEVDDGIGEAAREAFGRLVGEFTTVAGKIEKFTAAEGDDLAAARSDAAQNSLVAAFRAALQSDAAAERARRRAESGRSEFHPDRDRIEKLIGKHRPKIAKTFPPDKTADADALVRDTILAAYDGLIRNVLLRDGTLIAVIPDTAAIRAAEADDEADQADAQRMRGLADLRTACATYARTVLGDDKGGKKGKKGTATTFDKASVQAIVDEHAGAIIGATAGKGGQGGQKRSGSGHSQASDFWIAQTVADGLGPLAKKVTCKDGVLKIRAASLSRARAAYREAGDKIRLEALYEEAEQAFTDYLAKKSGQGANGVKQDRVQSIVNRVVKQIDKSSVGEASQRLEEIARTALGPMISALTIVDGVVTLTPADPDAIAAVKKETADAKAAKGRYLDEAESAERRYVIHTRVAGRLDTLKKALLADRAKKFVRADLDDLLAAGLGSRTDVFQLDDARDYLVALINTKLDGIVSVDITASGRLGRFEVNEQRLADLREEKAAADTDRAARAALVPALLTRLRPLAAKSGLPTVESLNAAVAKLDDKMAAFDAALVDRILEETVIAAFGADRIASVPFSNRRAIAPPVPVKRARRRKRKADSDA